MPWRATRRRQYDPMTTLRKRERRREGGRRARVRRTQRRDEPRLVGWISDAQGYASATVTPGASPVVYTNQAAERGQHRADGRCAQAHAYHGAVSGTHTIQAQALTA